MITSYYNTVIEANSIEQFNEIMKLCQERTNINIKITHGYINPIMLKQISFYDMNQQCSALTLHLSYTVVTTQDEFNIFCDKIPKCLPQLRYFAFSYWNKNIKNMDSLFLSIKKCDEVVLSLEGFKQFELTENLKSEDHQIKKLSLNLDKSTSTDNYINLAKFINSLTHLKKLELKINKILQLRMIQMLQNKSINLKIILKKADLQLCDLIKRVEAFSLVPIKKIVYGSHSIGCYLESKGYTNVRSYKRKHSEEVKCAFNMFYNQGELNLESFSVKDFRIIKENPYFTDYLKEQLKQNKLLKVRHNKNPGEFKYIYNSILSKLDISQPNIWAFNRSFNLLIAKADYMWRLHFEKKEFQNVLSFFRFKCNQLIINMSEEVNKEMDFLNYLSRTLIQFEYLVYFNFKRESYANPITDSIREIISQKAAASLRYIVFRKTIADHIPLQGQIFYDLLEP